MDQATFQDLQRLIAPIERRVRLLVSRVVIGRTKDSSGTQGVQSSALLDEIPESEHMQPGGLTHRPLAGAEGLLISVGATRDGCVTICVGDRRYRPKNLAEGETALYNEGAQQTVLKIAANGDIEVALATGAALKVGTGTQPVLKGAAFLAALNTFLTALHTYIKIPTPSPTETGTYETAASALTTALGSVQSTVIMGE
jgi:phage baseplate assembly protein V